MASTSLLESNSILFSKRRQNFHCNSCFTKPVRLAIKSAKFTMSFRFDSVKVQSLVNSGSNSTSNSSTTVRSSSKGNALDKDDCEGMVRDKLKRIMMTVYMCLIAVAINLPYGVLYYYKRKVCLEIQSTERCYSTDDIHCCRCSTDDIHCCRYSTGRHTLLFNSANNGPSFHGSNQHSDMFNQNDMRHQNDMDLRWLSILFIVPVVVAYIEFRKIAYPVIKLQVSRILRRRYTSFSDGRAHLLKKITTKLREYVKLSVAGYSSAKMCKSIQDAEEFFKQLSKEEEEKFDELANLKSLKKKITIFNEVLDWERRFLVLTVLMVARREIAANFHYPQGNDIRGAINQLGIIHDSSEVQAVDLFWTPQNEDSVM